MTPLLEVLRSRRVLLMDGATGTELQRRGLKPGANTAAWNVLHPDRVEAVHRGYLDAGADVLLTNTFSINCHSHDHDLVRAGKTLSRKLVWTAALERTGTARVYRLLALGPVAGDPGGREFDDLRRVWLPGEGLCRLWTPGSPLPDGLLLETCSTPRVRLAVGRVRGSGVPVLVSLAFHRDAKGKLVTASGHSPDWFARRARDYGMDALGVNCGVEIGMDEVTEIVRRYRDATDLPLFARPNAGTPRKRGKAWVYPRTPEEMADRLPPLLEAGVSMVGGCCGTTPAHVAAFRVVVDGWNARHGWPGGKGTRRTE
jgi:methionine synthase I (cobalamin-dependent)